MNKIIKGIYLCLGLGATSPLLSFVMGGRVLSLMTLSLILVIIDLFISKRTKLKSHRKNKLYSLFMTWMLISIVASIVGFVYFANISIDYSISSVKHIPKILLYILLTILLINNANKNIKVNQIIKGIAVGIAVNIIWSMIDAGMYYTIHKSLTNIVFKRYIEATDMHFGIASIVDGFTIRSVGLNNDPATIGFFATVGATYGYVEKKKWIIFICILSCIACVSFVGLSGIAIVTVYNLVTGVLRMSAKSIVYILLIGLIGGMSYYYVSEIELFKSVKTAMELRASSKVEGDHSSETRILFIKKFPNAIYNMPISMIIGTGYSTAVYPYYKEGLCYPGHGDIPTYMENNYVDFFFSFGLVGFLFFILFYIKLFEKYKKILQRKNYFVNDIIYSVSLSALISFAFYHYTLYSVIMLVSIAGLVINDDHYPNPKNYNRKVIK